jgi:hypothetical protein
MAGSRKEGGITVTTADNVTTTLPWRYKAVSAEQPSRNWVFIGIVVSFVAVLAMLLGPVVSGRGKNESIDVASYESGLLSWFEDSLHVTSKAQDIAAFRRCSGDRDKHTCLVIVTDSPRSAIQRAIAARLAHPFVNQFPVAFSEIGLLFSNDSDIYSYDHRANMIHAVAQDAWTPSLSPNGRLLAYLTSFRSGGANVHLLDLKLRTIQKLTNFKGKSPGGQWIRWRPDGEALVFELQDDHSHTIDTWSIRVGGSELRRIGEGQIFDLGNSTTATNAPKASDISSITRTSDETRLEVERAFVNQERNLPQGTKTDARAVIGYFALLTWWDEYSGGEALLQFDSSKGWVTKGGTGGELTVRDLVDFGVPQSIAEQLRLEAMANKPSLPAQTLPTKSRNGILPPTPVTSHGVCPFEGCQYGRWTARVSVDMFESINGRQLTRKIEIDEDVQAVSGTIYAMPKKAKVTRVYKTDQAQGIHVGNTVYALYPIGEGALAVWHDGRVKEGSLDLALEYMTPIAGSPLEWTWWVRIRLRDGIDAWIKNPRDFKGMDRFE